MEKLLNIFLERIRISMSIISTTPIAMYLHLNRTHKLLYYFYNFF